MTHLSWGVEKYFGSNRCRSSVDTKLSDAEGAWLNTCVIVRCWPCREASVGPGPGPVPVPVPVKTHSVLTIRRTIQGEGKVQMSYSLILGASVIRPSRSVQNILIECKHFFWYTWQSSWPWHNCPQFHVQPAGLTSGHPPTAARAVKTASALHPGIHPVHHVKMAQAQSSPKNAAVSS